jgi:glycosyltransferase involved in cell wall biosynthesis
MHVVLLHYYYHKPTPAYQQLAAALQDLGHTVCIGKRSETGDLIWLEAGQVVEVTRGPIRFSAALRHVPLVGQVLKRLAFLGFVRRMRAFLRQSQPEIVQVNPASMHWVGLLPLFMPARMHFVLDLRQVGRRRATGLVGMLKRWWAYVWDQIHARFIYDRTCFLHPAGATKVLGSSWARWATVVPLGVSDGFLSLEHEGSNGSHASEPVRFVYVGTLSRIRQLEQLVYAVEQMSYESRDFRVVFIGPDRSCRFYHDLIGRLELGSVIMIQPPVPHKEIPQVVSSFDVALAYVPARPADWQYHPTLKVLEYRALGVPILASDNQPNRDVVEHGVNGLLVQNSIEGLAQGMLRFVQDADLLRRCKANAQTMRMGKSWKDVARIYEQDVYLDLLSRGPLSHIAG